MTPTSEVTFPACTAGTSTILAWGRTDSDLIVCATCGAELRACDEGPEHIVSDCARAHGRIVED